MTDKMNNRIEREKGKWNVKASVEINLLMNA